MQIQSGQSARNKPSLRAALLSISSTLQDTQECFAPRGSGRGECSLRLHPDSDLTPSGLEDGQGTPKRQQHGPSNHPRLHSKPCRIVNNP
eukprot:3335436-Rhodomonas_salina.4